MLRVVDVPGKGKGVVAGRAYRRGEHVCAYDGELISAEEADRREQAYAAATDAPTMPCYMFWFSTGNISYCVDATDETKGGIARFINHSRWSANIEPRARALPTPGIEFHATRTILAGEELLYDYGERDPDILQTFPWLKM